MKTFKQQCEEKGYKVYCDDDEIANLPKKKEGKIEVFTLKKYVTDDELQKEYESRGLTPADPYSLLDFWDGEEYIATHWKDADGKWCYSAFNRWYDGRGVRVSRRGSDWHGNWFFAGVKKELTVNGNGEDLKDKILGKKEVDENDCWNWLGAKRKWY